MNVRGKWRVVKTPGYDMATPGSYILFDKEGGEFALDCLTGSIYRSSTGNVIESEWAGNNEMDETAGDGWAQLQPNGHLKGSVSKTVTTFPSSPENIRLLQQPARLHTT